MKSTTLAASAGASGFSAALVVILVWLLSLVHITVPPEVAVAVGTILTSATHYLVTLDGPFRKETPIPPQQSGDSPK